MEIRQLNNQDHLWHRSICDADFVAVCEMPQSIEELFFMFPKASYPLTAEQLHAAIMKRWDSTVVLLQNKIVGFANFYELEVNKYCSIGNVIVDSHYRNRGIGKYLIETMEKIAKEKYNVIDVHLSCFNQNTKGILLYSKLGYKPYAVESRKGTDGEQHALIEMKKSV